MFKKTFFLTLILLISISFAASTKEYQITSASLDYRLNADGTVDIHEEISYYFSSGTFSELYIRLPPDLQISDQTGNCNERQCSFRTQMNEGWREFVLSSSFSAGQHETAVFDYRVHSSVLSQKDASQFFFKLWGDQWEKPVGTLTATVEFPGDSSKVQYFTHPYDMPYEITLQPKSMKIVSMNHPAETYLEVNILMPSDWFSGLPQAKNFMTSQEIINGEKMEAEAEKNRQQMGLIIGLILLISVPLVLLICYYLFGRETPLLQLGYEAIFEHEPPGELSPTAAAKLIGKGNNGDYIAAEILNLVQNKFIALDNTTEKSMFSGMRDETVVVMRILKSREDAAALEPHQTEVFKFLKQVSENNVVTSKDLDEISRKSSYLWAFQKLEKSLSESFDRKKYLDTKGNIIAIPIFALIFLLPFFLLALFSKQIPLLAAVCIESVAAIVLVWSRPTLLGKWNDEGRVLEAKWQNFYKFLNDMTLMRGKAPADIALWEKYLVYSTAFGISGKVTEVMKTKFPDYSKRSSLPMYSSFYLASSLRNSTHSMSSSFYSMSSGGGGGGFGAGGGGGGGGGGAR